MLFQEGHQIQMRGIHMKKNSLLLIIFTLVIGLNINVHAVLKRTYSITSSVISEIEEWIDDDTMVFIALDETLVRPDYKMFASGINPYRNFESNLISSARRKSSELSRLEKWYNQRKLVLMEEEWKSFIQRLQDKGALVFGMSDMLVHFKDIEKKRYIELFNLGISFSSEINGQNVIVLGEKNKKLSLFYSGIVFSGSFGNANSIVNLVKIAPKVPSKVVYFDSRENEVRLVDKILRPLDMDFYSVVYHAIKKYKPKINYEEVKFQQMYFLNTGVLLDDSQVPAAMKEAIKVN